MSLYPKVIPLAPPDRMFKLATHKVILDWNVLASLGTTAALTQQIFPGQTPAQRDAGTTPTGVVPVGTRVRFAGFELVTAFDYSDASLISMTMSVGDGNSVARFVVAKELAVDGTEILEWSESATTQPYAYPITDGIDVVLTQTSGKNLNTATSGEVHIYLHISQPNARAK